MSAWRSISVIKFYTIKKSISIKADVMQYYRTVILSKYLYIPECLFVSKEETEELERKERNILRKILESNKHEEV